MKFLSSMLSTDICYIMPDELYYCQNPKSGDKVNNKEIFKNGIYGIVS